MLTSCHGLPHAHAVISSLKFPAAFTIDPNGHTIWYAERYNGEIHRRDLDTGKDTLVWTVPNLITAGEQGLLGLALHPGWPSSPYVYAYASRKVGGVERDQILKISTSLGKGYAQKVIMDEKNIRPVHNGGRIKFGPDGALYAVVGEHANQVNAQTINGNTNLGGKVLRMTPDGGVPAGNPFPGSVVWAYGIRNSFGFTFDPRQGNLWLTDNGPTCNDEMNRIIKAGNYGWGPQATCATPPSAPLNTNQSGALPRQLPRHFYPAQGITGTAFCAGCGLGDKLEGRLLFSTFNNGQFHSLTLDAQRTGVVNDTIVYDHPRGVLSVETQGPGHPVYFSDSTAIYRLTLVG
jgi:glucose/arabinose dehydrogenase